MLSYAGMVIKDNLGRVFGSQSVLTSHVPMTFAAKTLAYFHAVRLVLDIGLQEVTIEGDSLTMIRKKWRGIVRLSGRTCLTARGFRADLVLQGGFLVGGALGVRCLGYG
ncbi:hypothetical protein Godav_021018 [Gossypium davidsonii]|uniref:RNase H type-1 domain-containing protein n=1 Tax=Gossypium davidsonii TaxID=34287 RepID=A0A7J8R4Y3_GOSDV|nr:hypothetical protein [Gossypium davidsonii]